MDFGAFTHPLIFFLGIITIITIFLSYISEDMYLFIIPSVAVIIYLSAEGYLDRWIWVVIGLASAFWFSYAIYGGGNR